MKTKNNASFLRRLLARFLDLQIVTIIIGLLFLSITGSFSLDWRSSITWDVFYTLYLVITPVIWYGFVIGKRICKIKIKRTNGDNVRLLNTFLREIVGFHLIGILTLGLSIPASMFMVLFREDKRAIHDIVGGTYVGKAY